MRNQKPITIGQKSENKKTILSNLYFLFVTLLLIWLILPQAMCLGAIYYVDATNGNDSNDGLSPGTAWKTIAKVNSQTLSPGDSVLFKRGEVWREQLTVPSSGNAGAPITFGAYGTGEKPEINGADVITGWSVYSGNIYVANVSSEVTQLFVDGEKQTLARWPNSGWQNIDANSSNNTSLYSESLTQPDNYWVGATIAVKTAVTCIAVKTVVSNSGLTITWDNEAENGPAAKDYGFYLEGELEEIDIPGEWCYDTGKVYLMMAGGDHPDNHLIEGSVRESGVEIVWDKEYVDIENIRVNCVGRYGIYVENCDYINIRNNIIMFGGVGIKAYSYPDLLHGHIYISGNIIKEIQQGDGTWGGAGIWAGGLDHAEITNNEITDIVSDGRSPRFGCGISWGGENILISNNRIDRISYNGINGGGERVTVSHNVISNCLLLLDDGGGIYTASKVNSALIEHNIISDIIGNTEGTPYAGRVYCPVGIYLDNTCSGYTVKGNIVFNCPLGILVHMSYNNTVINNTLYNNNVAISLSEKAPNEMHDNNIYNNILLCTNPNQLTWREGTYPTSTNVVKGEYNYNLHYNPYREDAIIYGKGDVQRYTLDTWRAFSGQDGHSIAQDPLFANTSNRDFHLKSNSPCIDAGGDVGLTQDFEGNPVPQGKAPDIGAYEYVFFPISVIKNEPKEGRVPLTVSFDGSQSTSFNGDIVSYEWDFGDGTTSTGMKTSHTFTSAGEYTVTLTVTDTLGLKGESQTHITVFEKEFRELPAGCYNNVINPSKGEKALIVVELSKQARVKLNLYNTRGNRIRELADEEKEAGPHKYYWNGKDDNENVVGSGLYFVHIQAGDYKKTKKIVVVK